MGEAKRRGTFEQRQREAIARGTRKMSFYSAALRARKREAKMTRIRILESLMLEGYIK